MTGIPGWPSDGPNAEMFSQVPRAYLDGLKEAKMPPGPLREAANEPTRPAVSTVRCPAKEPCAPLPNPWRSLDDEIRDVEVAKFDRLMHFFKPTFDASNKTLTTVGANVNTAMNRMAMLEKKFDDFESSIRWRFTLLVLANAAVIVFFYYAF